ncbi:hypothetical protein C2L71_01810 [Enteroscipio rubneri]|uniref:Uncharacterized protein n=1 Tax=Enteroscipio rubneri TaxID=2070686 RepID=A0A2K2UEU4_9ACTN|nr:hypothetical protein C2L71_01810 [Enteroscipio rubneri]
MCAKLHNCGDVRDAHGRPMHIANIVRVLLSSGSRSPSGLTARIVHGESLKMGAVVIRRARHLP